jgi:DNA mismatch repair ATPase MutS
MQKLLSLPAKGLIATHDLSLCDLAEVYPGQVINQRFEVSFEGDELAFDYTLREGVCENMNASFLLRKMGLVID